MIGITEYVYLWLSFWSSWRAWTWAETTCSSNMESTRRSNPKVYHYQPPTALAPGEMYKKDIRKTGRGPQIIYEYIIPVDFVPDLHNQINRCDVYFAATSYPKRWNITIHIDYILIRLIPDKTLAGWCWMVLPPKQHGWWRSPGSPPPLWLKSSHSWRGEAAGDGAGGDEQNDGQNLIKNLEHLGKCGENDGQMKMMIMMMMMMVMVMVMVMMMMSNHQYHY